MSWAAASRLPAAMQRRDDARARAVGIQGAHYLAHGEVAVGALTSTNVELEADVKFPVRFIEKPSPSGAFELAAGSVLTAGYYPQMGTPLVVSWVTVERPYGAVLYVGARLAFVITGPVGTSGIAHWQMYAKALLNPERPSIAGGMA